MGATAFSSTGHLDNSPPHIDLGGPGVGSPKGRAQFSGINGGLALLVKQVEHILTVWV